YGRILDGEEGFDVGTAVDLSPGDLIATKNDLDVAINGSGFFAIQTPQGVRYTRNGSFSLSATGDLVTKDGNKVLSTNDSPIHVGEGQIGFGDNGTVTVDGNEIATLKIVTFKKTEGLQKEGFYRFAFNGDAKDIENVQEIRVKSGHLEHSNVNAVDEMVHLMA